MRLPKRDRGTIVSSQAGETRRRSLDDLDLEIAFPKSAERQQLARGNCNRTRFVRKADQFSLEVSKALDFRPRDQAVNGIVEFGGDNRFAMIGYQCGRAVPAPRWV